jgi:hypothetical protein
MERRELLIDFEYITMEFINTVKPLLIPGPQLIPEPHLIPGVVKALKQ